jgi:hypothetical protein
MLDRNSLRQMPADPHQIKAMIDALIMEYPEMAEDKELFAVTIEGETNIHEMLERLLDKIRAAQTMQEAIGSRIDALKNRKGAFELREEYMRKLTLKIMDAAQVRKVQLVEATLSVRPSPQGVRIIMDDLIPEEFWRVKREIDLTKIKSAIKAGENVPGAALSNAHDTLAILPR